MCELYDRKTIERLAQVEPSVRAHMTLHEIHPEVFDWEATLIAMVVSLSVEKHRAVKSLIDLHTWTLPSYITCDFKTGEAFERVQKEREGQPT